MQEHPIFIVSDRSGVTASTISHTLLSQFPSTKFNHTSYPFIDSIEKVKEVVAKIDKVAESTGLRPLVFATFVEEAFFESIKAANAEIFDLFDPFIHRMEQTLGQTSSHLPGQAHGMADKNQYNRRIEAVNYALHCDDGLHIKDYKDASIILLGVSRSGKTPTCLYIALHMGLYVANFPLTEEVFERSTLPESILRYKNKAFGLTIDPQRLHQIRSERRPGSSYASVPQCREDVRLAQQLYNQHRIPYCDSTAYSVEELGSTISHRMGLESLLH